MEKDGGWLFISHSHKDVDVVRKIRNLFEERGFEPLMFFLKCLSDKDEVESLIKREIDEREWFVYVESPNSEKSNWVRTEREYIATLTGKKIFTINIDEDIEAQVDRISKRLKVYISCSHRDYMIFDLIKKRLTAKDYLVLSDEDLVPGEILKHQVASEITDSARNGFVIVLISENTKKNYFVEYEIKLAKEKDAIIVPVYIGDASLDDNLLLIVGKAQGVYIDKEPTNEQIDDIVSYIQCISLK